MKHKLIMENWRRFISEEDDHLIVENKRKSFETLMLEVDQGTLDLITITAALNEQVGNQIASLENKLNEGFWKDMSRKAVDKFSNFAASSLDKVVSLVKKAASKNSEKIIKIGIEIVNKISSLGNRLFSKGFALASLIVKVGSLLSLYLLLSLGVAQGGVSSVSLSDFKTAKTVLVQPVIGQATDLSSKSITTRSAELPTDALGVSSSGEDAQVEMFQQQWGKKMDRVIIDSVEVLEGLIVKAEQKGSPLTAEEIEGDLLTVQDEVAVTVLDTLEMIQQYDKIDPEGAKQASEQARQFGISVETTIRSFETKTLDDTDGVTGGLGMQKSGAAVYTKKSIQIPE